MNIISHLKKKYLSQLCVEINCHQKRDNSNTDDVYCDLNLFNESPIPKVIEYQTQ